MVNDPSFSKIIKTHLALFDNSGIKQSEWDSDMKALLLELNRYHNL